MKIFKHTLANQMTVSKNLVIAFFYSFLIYINLWYYNRA